MSLLLFSAVVIAAGTTPVCKSEGRCLVFCILLLTWPEAYLQNTSILDNFTGCLQKSMKYQAITGIILEYEH